MIDFSNVEKEYKLFNEVRMEYQDWMEGSTTVSQRVFASRIKASYALRNFIEKHSDNKITKCYKSYLMLVDAWFSYEALLPLAGEMGYLSKSNAKPEKLLKSVITNEYLEDITKEFYDKLKPITNKNKRKTSLLKYLDVLLSYPGTTNNQKQYLIDFKKEIENGVFQNNNYYRILSFIYAIRNAYVHNGETARSGTGHFIVKLLILSNAYEFMLKFLLRVATAIYEEAITDIS